MKNIKKLIMKPLNIKNYGSIPHLSNSKLGKGDHHIDMGQEKILTVKKRDKHDKIFAFEKYDGSNVGICKVKGEILAITRSGYLANTSKYDLHLNFNNWVQVNRKLFEHLPEGYRLVGEWLETPVSIIYKYNDPIVFYDLFNDKNERQTIDKLSMFLEVRRLPIARQLGVYYNNDPMSVESLINELNLKDYRYFGNEDPEGIIYRVERKGKVDFIAKWVREDFEAGKLL